MDAALVLLLIGAALAFFLQITWLYVALAVLFAALFIVEAMPSKRAPAVLPATAPATGARQSQQPIIIVQSQPAQKRMGWFDILLGNLYANAVMRGESGFASWKNEAPFQKGFWPEEKMVSQLESAARRSYVNTAVDMLKSGKSEDDVKKALRQLGERSEKDRNKVIATAKSIV
jgi:hypothetical protein